MPLPQEKTLLDMTAPGDDADALLAQAQRRVLEQAVLAKLGPSKAYIRKEPWFHELPITYRDRDVLGRIWSFQASSEGCGGGCYISLSTFERDTGIDKSTVKKSLVKMVKLGILDKEERGEREPPIYRLNLVRCNELLDEREKARAEARQRKATEQEKRK